MTQHNIIGSERSGPHVVVRYTAKPRRPMSFWLFMAVQLVACSLPILLLLAVTS